MKGCRHAPWLVEMFVKAYDSVPLEGALSQKLRRNLTRRNPPPDLSSSESSFGVGCSSDFALRFHLFLQSYRVRFASAGNQRVTYER